MRRFPQIAFALLLLLAAATRAAADFVQLERLLQEPAAELAEKIKGKTAVVAVRNGMKPGEPWDIGQAAGVELTIALRRHDIDAIRAACDARLNSLEGAGRTFTQRQAQSLKPVGREALVGVEWYPGKRPRLKLVALTAKSAKPLWTRTIEVQPNDVALENNLPSMNRAAVEYARQNLGRAVRDGDCTHLAEECLKAAGTGKRGTYRWGRELGPREPWLPGDILQMERLKVDAPGLSRDNPHHTAVVEEMHHGELVVLHQNAYPDGKVVQRDRWPIAGISGAIAAFRPWDWPKSRPLPPASPRRTSPPLVVGDGRGKTAGPIDLLKLVDPEIDRIQGIWFFDKEALRSPNEFEARLQIPVVPPGAYALNMSIERLQGVECFGLGIVVGGRQTMLVVDAFKQQTSGIHNLDGKPVQENESARSGTFLPLRKRVELQCRIREDEIVLQIDKAPVIEWRGDATRLSLSPDWPVPHADWLFLGAFDSEFDIRSFTLEPLPR
ncbi:MAG TPA: CHAP domain-containing protein [Pirellulales bacterium]|nr:CHAP domain-containing protein [Pirellulales bacterium]